MDERIQRYVHHWEHVIAAWHLGHGEARWHGCEDEPFLRALGPVCFPCTCHMPEPYWGNPENSSIVIVNHNPGCGGGPARQGHLDAVEWMESFTKTVGYHVFAKEFPIGLDKDSLKNKRWNAFSCYQGRKWWKRRVDWTKETARLLGIDDGNCLPFAMELCGWHSPRWPSSATETVLAMDRYNELVQDPLLAAMEASRTKAALCVGKRFSEVFEKARFVPVPDIAPLPQERFRVFTKNGLVAVVTFGARQHVPEKNRYWNAVSEVINRSRA